MYTNIPEKYMLCNMTVCFSFAPTKLFTLVRMHQKRQSLIHSTDDKLTRRPVGGVGGGVGLTMIRRVLDKIDSYSCHVAAHVSLVTDTIKY